MAGRHRVVIVAWVGTVLRSSAASCTDMDSPYAYPTPSPCRRHPSRAIAVTTATLTATIAASTVGRRHPSSVSRPLHPRPLRRHAVAPLEPSHSFKRWEPYTRSTARVWVS
jgi:hypothetical protein